MLRVLDSRQIAEWMAYYDIEPFGEQPAYWRSAMIAHVIANVNRGKSQSAFTIEDFMPKETREKRRDQTPRDMIAVLRGVIKSTEAQQKKKGRKC